MEAKAFPPLTALANEGLRKEINEEFTKWNTRDNIERFPLSPSQIGKCGLKLARDLAHYLSVRDYPRQLDSRDPRTQRIFKRGDLLEDALIVDLERGGVEVIDKQRVVTLFPLSKEHAVKGSIDGIGLIKGSGARFIVDFKSKGAFYSAGFKDSISEFFGEMVQTGVVEMLGEKGDECYFIKDVKKLFDLISMDDFFVDYILQLNSYAFAEGMEPVDFVSLYYENKNSCHNYEVRWVPHPYLFEWAKNKLQHIYDTVRSKGPEAVDKEFSLGSAKCRLCDYNAMCWGTFVPKPATEIVKGSLTGDLADKWRKANEWNTFKERMESAILTEMENRGLTHFTTNDGLTYTRKFLKSPKPHYELRLTSG
jgi:hypothetical protein